MFSLPFCFHSVLHRIVCVSDAAHARGPEAQENQSACHFNAPCYNNIAKSWAEVEHYLKPPCVFSRSSASSVCQSVCVSPRPNLRAPRYSCVCGVRRRLLLGVNRAHQTRHELAATATSAYVYIRTNVCASMAARAGVLLCSEYRMYTGSLDRWKVWQRQAGWKMYIRMQ